MQLVYEYVYHNRYHTISNYYIFQAATLARCNLKHYTVCRNLSKPLKDECLNQCLRPCEQLSIFAKVEELQSYYFASRSPITAINLYISTTHMSIYEEKLSFTFETFLGTLGGIVGFLLSYSLFDLLCIAYLLFARLFELFLAKLKLKFFKKSQTIIIEVQPAAKISNDSDDDSRSTVVKSDTFSKFTNLLCKVHIIGWAVGKLKWNLSSVFKCILIGCFFYKTVEVSVPIAQHFLEKPTVYKMKLVNNESITLKPATLCIYLHPRELTNTQRLKQHAHVEEFFNYANMTKTGFLESRKWTNDLRYIVNMYLYWLATIELGPYLYYENHDFDFTLPYLVNQMNRSLLDDPRSTEDSYKAFVYLEAKLESLNISVYELRQKFGLEVCKLLNCNFNTLYLKSTICKSQTFLQTAVLVNLNSDTFINEMQVSIAS